MLRAACGMLVLLWALQTQSDAKDASGSAAQKSAAESQQAELRARLRQLNEDISKAEARRSETRDALRDSEAAISESNRILRELGEQLALARARLKELGEARRQTLAESAEERQRLGQWVRAQYFAGHRSPMQLLMLGENPNQIGRDLAYVGYFSRAQQATIDHLEAQSRQLKALAADEQEHANTVARVASEQQEQRQKLENQKRQRTALLQKVSDKIKAQRREAGSLERDAQRLNSLIDRLARVMADEQRKARERREAERRDAELRRQTERESLARSSNGSRPGPEIASRNVRPGDRAVATDGSASGDAGDGLDAYGSGKFAALRGKLRLPVSGLVVRRFGQTLPGSDGKASAKGVFIKAAPGSEVHAVADGRVVFADWLRGFGNLLIVDHGDQYLSIYGSNEALFKQAGQVVKAGEAVASVGATGGADQTGLYFEVRHRGEPFDPLQWVR
jgi:septal ring factor EnvC (AmiA/AmiB activator)